MQKCTVLKKTTAIIPAAGNGQRWGDYLGVVKHLAPVGDTNREPLILRTVRLLKELGIDDIFIVTHTPQIIETVESTVRVIRPENYHYLSDTILSSKSVWSERTLILLGDVYFSRECIERIVHCEKNICFWGLEPGMSVCKQRLRRPEVYGFSFCAAMQKVIDENLILNSLLSAMRDRGFFMGRTMQLGSKVFYRVFRQNYSPKPPGMLRKWNFSGSNIWCLYRALKLRKPSHVWRYGKLWGLYLMVSDTDPFGGSDYNWPEHTNGYFAKVEDITRDIDFPHDYLELSALSETKV